MIIDSAISNSIIKLYASLASNKGRRQHGLFMVQGSKCVCDTIGHFHIDVLLATDDWCKNHSDIVSVHNTMVVRKADLQRISTLVSVPDVIGIYHIPEIECPNLDNRLVLALDGVQDPGNLGTIIRVADWMGVDTILASTDTVDVYNPKVVQATMGAISRVHIYYCELTNWLSEYNGNVYGTFMHGQNIYDTKLDNRSVVVMGNEGNGISAGIEKLVKPECRLNIPSAPFDIEKPADAGRSESLNVAVATAITLAEFRRQQLR